MRYNFSSIKTSHVYKNIKKYYYLVFKGMKKSKTIMKIFVLLGDFSPLSNCYEYIYEPYWLKYFQN